MSASSPIKPLLRRRPLLIPLMSAAPLAADSRRGCVADGIGCTLAGADLGMDRCLENLYDEDRSGGLGGSAPRAACWLGDIRSYFPSAVVRVLQQDALQRYGLQRLLLEPEMLEAVEPDVHLVATLLSLNRVMPAKYPRNRPAGGASGCRRTGAQARQSAASGNYR
ncbi:MAG: hypothetical protein U1F42_01665 [Candidatus Competibacteraceae bacterium]